MTTPIFLGSVAIEPNRWAMVDPSWCATIAVSEHLDTIADAGFDGVEIWEKHLTEADEDELGRLLGHQVPMTVFNSYVGFDAPEPDFRDLAAEWTTRSGAAGVKFNVGNDPALQSAYAERVAAWLDRMPDHVRLLCECHSGISIAEEPAVAAAIFEAAGPPDRVQAIVHSGEDDDHIRARFDHYGERIGHIHVNHLAEGSPKLADIRPSIEAKIGLLRELGFTGSWTIEFTHGVASENDDNPAFILERATEDLALLRELLD